MPCVEKINLVRRDAFPGYDGCRVVTPNGHPFFWFNVDIQWVSGSYAEWPPLFWFNVDIQWVSGSHAEWLFLYLFNVDVQWLSGSQAEWLFSFYCST